MLRGSYDLLPSDLHRLMFLDAALMLQGCPVAHLISVWEAELLLGFFPSSLPSRFPNEPLASWQSRKAHAAAGQVRVVLDDLHGPFISYDDTLRTDPLNPR